MEAKTNTCSLTLRFLILFLGFSFLLSSATATRSLKSSIPLVVVEEEAALEMSENEIERRMVLENTDYPGTGANNHHDPKTPGRA